LKALRNVKGTIQDPEVQTIGLWKEQVQKKRRARDTNLLRGRKEKK